MAGDFQPLMPMKKYTKTQILLPALIAVLNLIPAGRVPAQTFTTLHSFAEYSDGNHPFAGLVLSGNTLYGTASDDSTAQHGTVFSLSFRPQLTITPAGPNVIQSWPTNVVGFDYTGDTLQSATSFVSPAFWVPVSPAPVVLNGQYTMTILISGTQQFFRLSQ